MSDAKLRSGVRLTKEERKELLAQLERQASRAESAERILQRGEQALKDGQLDQARRVLTQLTSKAPRVPGLDQFRTNLEAVQRESRRTANLKATEEMLTRYIQQRKKPLADLALATLIDLEPNHPRRKDYEVWVGDLDKEVALQQRIEEQIVAGRDALRRNDIAGAGKHLGALRKLDPDSRMTEEFAAELTRTEQGQAEVADIGRAKQRIEELLASEQLDEAEHEMDRLQRMDIPKVTIDFLRKRIEDSRRRRRDLAEAKALIGHFEEHLRSFDWPSARETAQRFSQHFPTSPKAAELFNRVNALEAEQRRRQSLEEGLATVERFVAAGDRGNAELALRLLHRLDPDPARLAELESKVRRL